MHVQTNSEHIETEDKRIIQMQLEHFEREQHIWSSRTIRLEDLMSRKIVKKWKPAKVAKMIRRLSAAKKLHDTALSAVDNLTARLAEQQING